MNSSFHIPVLLEETIAFLAPKKGKTFVDCTLGAGGHTEVLLEKGSHVIGIDQDQDALNHTRDLLAPHQDQLILTKDNFKNIKNIVKEPVDGILMDLGVSSYQINTPERGFSLQQDGPLDMRMNPNQTLSAKDLVNNKSKEGLKEIIKNYGEEELAGKISKAIAEAKKPINTTGELRAIIEQAVDFLPPKRKLNAVTRVFQGLRIAVNNELENLKIALEDSIDLLKNKGRIVVISYHSLEDRIVKETFKKAATKCLCPPELPECRCTHKKSIKILTKKPITPKEKEIEQNPRSRSAKLRAAEKL